MQTLSDLIQHALDQRGAKNVIAPNPSNIREDDCLVDGCVRKAFAKGLCNAHYIRRRKGVDLSRPIRRRVKDAACIECNQPVGVHGGWGLCSSHYKKERRLLLKQLLVDHLGGVCRNCELSYPACVFDFHHLDGKIDALSDLIGDGSIPRIVSEVNKCILLCANCHRMEHATD